MKIMMICSERLGGDHSTKQTEDILIDGFLQIFADVPLGVDFSSVLDFELLLILPSLFLDSLRPIISPSANLIEILMAMFRYISGILQLESLIPFLFVEIEQHFLFKLVGPVVDVDGIVVFVKTLIHGFDGRFVKMTVD